MADTPSEPLVDPKFLTRLEQLELVSRKIFMGRMKGERRSKKKGQSVEFADYRNYVIGDDLRHLDWNAYARSDQLHVKLYREEVNPHLDVVIDGSRSMALLDSRKAEAAVGLAALFTAAATNAGFSHRAWLMGPECQPVRNSAARPMEWDGIAFDYAGNSAESLRRMPGSWRPRGMRLLVSDLLWVGDPLMILGYVAERAAGVVVVQVLAEADVHPAVEGNLRLVDSETEQVREIFFDAAAQKRYGETLVRHQQNWHRACRQVGGVMTTVVAETFLQDWRLEELVAAEVLKVT